MRAVLVVAATTSVLLTGCLHRQVPIETHLENARPTLALLQDARFDDAQLQAEAALVTWPDNPQLHAIRAITRFKAAAHQLVIDLMAQVPMLVSGRGFNQRYLWYAFDTADHAFARVDADLAAAAEDERFYLPLCLACWEYDWNHNGRIDQRDARFFEVEVDAHGERYPEGDPRRRPTFRFDHGDLSWGRAFVSFGRAALNLLQGYALPVIGPRFDVDEDPVLTLKLVDAEKVRAARRFLLAGLSHANRSRALYRAETDDDHEWFPNPKQKDHPLPLPVDEALYETWTGVNEDLVGLLEGRTALSVEELAQLGDDQWADPPQGYLDLRRFFEHPHDIVLDVEHLETVEATYRRTGRDVEVVLKEIFGDAYVKDRPNTPLVSRLARMKGELERGEESLEKKLRYLIWIN